MKRIFKIILIAILGIIIPCQCKDPIIEDLDFTEFFVGIWYPEIHQDIIDNKLYRIDSQEQMDELFADYPVSENPEYQIPNINFDEHTVFVVWGGYCHSNSEVKFKKIDNQSYIIEVTLIPTIDTGPDHRWSFACVTNRKLKSNETISLSIIEKEYEY